MSSPFLSGFGGHPAYALLMLAGIAIGAVYWWRVSRGDHRLPLIYAVGLTFALLGAKVSFLLAEGWIFRHSPDRWLIWASGKSVTGALLGGWAGVEIGKKLLGYRRITGDRFAGLIPIPLLLGRIGCLAAGCCSGIACPWGKWPSVPAEMAFQVAAFVVFLVWRKRGILTSQHFHVYLMAYGIFRFFHEFLRATPKPFAGLGGYQILSLAMATAGGIAFLKRRAARGRDAGNFPA